MQEKIKERKKKIFLRKNTAEPLFWDTSTQWAQTLASEKRLYNLFIRYLY